MAEDRESCSVQIYIVEKFEQRRKPDKQPFIVGMVSEGLGVRKSKPTVSSETESDKGNPKACGSVSVAEPEARGKVVACYLNQCATDLAREVLALEAGLRVVVTKMMRSGGCLHGKVAKPKESK